jgi:Na+/H+ antiporter NhaD/arsenite permease-like protein
MAVTGERVYHIPPFIGMLTGLSLLFLFGYYLKSYERKLGTAKPFNAISIVAQAEWDTLLFFYGVIFCVGGLSFLGYLTVASHLIYDQLGATTANILIGVFSSVVDNIPVMFAVLTMDPHMSEFQWLLVTMTAGVGGSLLAIGSAAGVALLGQSKFYTFGRHLKWSWAIVLGYAASIWVHFLVG